MKALLCALVLSVAGSSLGQLTITWDPPAPTDRVSGWEVWATQDKTAPPAFLANVATNLYRFESTPSGEVVLLVYPRNALGHGLPAGLIWKPSLPGSPSNLVSIVTLTNQVTETLTLTNWVAEYVTLTNTVTLTNLIAEYVTLTNSLTLTNLVTLTNFVSVTNAAPVGELVVNGGFEQGLTGWTLAGNVAPFTQASAGNYGPAGGLSAITFNNGQRAPNGTVSQSLAVVPGQSYSLTFSAGICSYNNFGQSLAVTVAGAGGLSLLQSTINLQTPPVTGSFYYLPKSFSFVADTNRVLLTFRDVSANTDAVDLLLDDVSMK